MTNSETDPKLPAFPYPGMVGGEGLTKREHFAAMALQGALASEVQTDRTGFSEYAADAVAMADALIDALNEVQK